MCGGIYVDDECMRTSYGVVWREGVEPLVAGKLELRPNGIRLDGLDGSRDNPYGSSPAFASAAWPTSGSTASVRRARARRGAPITIGTVAKPVSWERSSKSSPRFSWGIA